MLKDGILNLLKKKLVIATGCTEPIAIAYAAAVARKYFDGELETVTVLLSGNMVKNAMVVGIPGTDKTGIDFAVALGALFGDSEKKLEVLSGLKKEHFDEAANLVFEEKVFVEIAKTDEKLYIEVLLQNRKCKTRVIIKKTHTNLVLIEKNGEIIFEKTLECSPNTKQETEEEDGIIEGLSIDTIYEFIETCRLDELDIIRESILLNENISKEGLRKNYGLYVGKSIADSVKNGMMGNDFANYVVAATAAGADARMAGIDMPVMSNSGSGNQGIATTVPVVAAAKWLKCTEEKTIRAVALSNLIAIYIKLQFGVLSALCGAVISAAGTAAAIVYLMDGSLIQMKYAMQNTLGNITGMICDGAKADCSLKVATCTNAAIYGVMLAMNDSCITEKEGFIEKNIEYTIKNFSKLGNEGTLNLDKLLLHMMLNKRK